MLEQLTDRVGVFTGGVNVGIIRSGDPGGVILVDTGANEGNARKVLRFVREEMDATVEAILTTHAHADHFGGHAFVTRRTDAAVYASSVEASVLRNPELQPIFLYGGAAPPAALRERFVLAQPSPVDAIVEPGRIEVSGVDVDVVPLKGHSPNQVGYLVDGVFFCADVVFPDAAIEKYRIPYLFDLGNHIASMSAALEIECDHVVPGHGPVEHGIAELVERNRAIVEETLDVIRLSLTEPLSLEQLAEVVFERMDVPMLGHISYYLLRPTIGAYLSYLEGAGETEHIMDGKVAKWRRR